MFSSCSEKKKRQPDIGAGIATFFVAVIRLPLYNTTFEDKRPPKEGAHPDSASGDMISHIVVGGRHRLPANSTIGNCSDLMR